MKKLFEHHVKKISERLPGLEIEHVGGSSIPGALTKGDLDIVIRTERDSFLKIVEALKELYGPKYVDSLWNENFALYQDYTSPVKVDIMVTIKDSPYDTFTKVRDFLIANKDALDEYNEIKTHFNKIPYPEYLERKLVFFQKIIKDRLNIIS